MSDAVELWNLIFVDDQTCKALGSPQRRNSDFDVQIRYELVSDQMGGEDIWNKTDEYEYEYEEHDIFLRSKYMKKLSYNLYWWRYL